MSKLIKKSKRSSYYDVILFCETMDGEIRHTSHNVYNEKTVKKNFDEFIKLIKFIYIYYYTSPDTKAALEGFYHISDTCLYVDFYRDECEEKNNNLDKPSHKQCKHMINGEHLKSKFQLDIPSHPYEYYDYFYRISGIKIEYIDENSKIYDIDIKFDNKDINDIVKKIKKSHTVNYGWVFNKLCSSDPDIFLETYDKMKKIIIPIEQN